VHGPEGAATPAVLERTAPHVLSERVQPQGAIVAGSLVVLVVGLVGVRRVRYERRIAREARELWAAERARAVQRARIEALPPPVRRYLELSGATLREPVRAVRLRHGGTFRPALDKPWYPIVGEQYFGADPPGFVWRGRIRMAPGLSIHARDRSFAGNGNMLVQVASTWTIADVRGPEMDAGALLRLLAEMVWFPTAFLDERHVTWSPVDDAHARATLRVGDREVAATFRFGADGLPAGVVADRHRDVNGTGVLTPWTGEYGDYREVGGLRVPFRSEVSWIVDGRAQPYARWVFDRLEYDLAEPY
jgi:hypothetical protein